MDMRKWLYSYRLGQVRQQLGFVAPLAAGEYEEVSQGLPATGLAVFKTNSPAGQRRELIKLDEVSGGRQKRGRNRVGTGEEEEGYVRASQALPPVLQVGLPQEISLQETHYVVHLPIFEGPLDLLLHLIEKRQM